ncbi:MAG: HNH endonuclease signature motif containing protein [Colwellia sp.]|jgi:HNH endonuclease.
MKYDDYQESIKARLAELKIRNLPASVSAAQYKMLKHLWDVNDEFPRGWVNRDVLHSLTNQSDYRRRITELKDEIGVDVELNKKTNQYRLISSDLNPANPRTYLSKKQKSTLLASQDYTCQICGHEDINNTTGTLQADHKTPLSRGGNHTQSNWQTLCHVCNIGKRRSCEGCNRNCNDCPWAKPDITGINRIVKLDNETLTRLKKLNIVTEDELTGFIKQQLTELQA